MSVGTQPICRVRHLSLIPFHETWSLQEHLAAKIAAGTVPPTLLLLEHPHTFTFGRRGQPSHLLWSEVTLTTRGVEVHWADRGGDPTYRGPGQLVGCPLLTLGKVDTSSRLPLPTSPILRHRWSV